MRQHLEVELKWVLLLEESALLAEAIAARLGPAQTLDQHNRFFDAADGRLRRAGLSVRLRRENARLVLTCKRKTAPASSPGGLFSHDEWETEIDPDLWRAGEDSAPALAAAAAHLPTEFIDTLAGAPLVALGGFANRRLEWHDGDDLICLDRTEFTRGDVDHELEVETVHPAETGARWRRIFADLGIVERPQTATKFARYLARAAR